MPTVLPLTSVTVNPSLKARAYTLHAQAYKVRVHGEEGQHRVCCQTALWTACLEVQIAGMDGAGRPRRWVHCLALTDKNRQHSHTRVCGMKPDLSQTGQQTDRHM